MKYAFVALIAVYLFTYGCIQEDKEEPKSASHEMSQTSTEHAAPPAEEAAVEQTETAPAAAHVEKAPAAETHVEKAPAAEAHAKKDTAAGEEKTEEVEKKTEQVAELPPCARNRVEGDNAAALAPCGKPCPAMKPQAQTSGAQPTRAELKAAMENMVRMTNKMVLMTHQMILATQQILEATQDDTEEKATEPEKQ